MSSPNQPRSRTTSNGPTRELYQAASNHFLHRSHALALGSLSQLFGLLPPAPAQAWAADLPARTRTAERWRTKATELMVTAEVMLYKSTAEGAAHDPRRTEEHYAALERRAVDLFAPSPLPPSVVLTLSRACVSLGLPLALARQTIETWLAAIAPGLLPALAVAVEDHPDDKWVQEAAQAYEETMEHYWVETSEGEAAREEARRLVEWDQVVAESSKERILARLVDIQTALSATDSSQTTLPQIASVVSLSSFAPSSPEMIEGDRSFGSSFHNSASESAPAGQHNGDDDDTEDADGGAGGVHARALTNRSAYTGSLQGSPTLSARELSPSPTPRRPATLAHRILQYLSPLTVTPVAFVLFALFVLRRARARRMGWRALLKEWVITAATEVMMEFAGIWQLGTALTYV